MNLHVCHCAVYSEIPASFFPRNSYTPPWLAREFTWKTALGPSNENAFAAFGQLKKKKKDTNPLSPQYLSDILTVKQ